MTGPVALAKEIPRGFFRGVDREQRSVELSELLRHTVQSILSQRKPQVVPVRKGESRKRDEERHAQRRESLRIHGSQFALRSQLPGAALPHPELVDQHAQA